MVPGTLLRSFAQLAVRFSLMNTNSVPIIAQPHPGALRQELIAGFSAVAGKYIAPSLPNAL